MNYHQVVRFNCSGEKWTISRNENQKKYYATPQTKKTDTIANFQEHTHYLMKPNISEMIEVEPAIGQYASLERSRISEYFREADQDDIHSMTKVEVFNKITAIIKQIQQNIDCYTSQSNGSQQLEIAQLHQYTCIMQKQHDQEIAGLHKHINTLQTNSSHLQKLIIELDKQRKQQRQRNEKLQKRNKQLQKHSNELQSHNEQLQRQSQRQKKKLQEHNKSQQEHNKQLEEQRKQLKVSLERRTADEQILLKENQKWQAYNKRMKLFLADQFNSCLQSKMNNFEKIFNQKILGNEAKVKKVQSKAIQLCKAIKKQEQKRQDIIYGMSKQIELQKEKERELRQDFETRVDIISLENEREMRNLEAAMDRKLCEYVNNYEAELDTLKIKLQQSEAILFEKEKKERMEANSQRLVSFNLVENEKPIMNVRPSQPIRIKKSCFYYDSERIPKVQEQEDFSVEPECYRNHLRLSAHCFEDRKNYDYLKPSAQRIEDQLEKGNKSMKKRGRAKTPEKTVKQNPEKSQPKKWRV